MDQQSSASPGPSASARAGTAAIQGPLWGRRAADYSSVQEPQLDPVYRDVLAAIPVAGRSVLDVGCGSGRFLELATMAGAAVDGLDASPALIAQALARIPGARVVRGEMQALPHADARFDLVTGFNAYQWAADRVAAFLEAGRVMRADGRFVVATWGPPEVSDAAVHFEAIARLLPPPLPGAPDPLALAEPTVLDATLEAAGFHLLDERQVWTEWRYPDLTTALRGLLAGGPATRAAAAVGDAAVIDAVIGSLRRFRVAGGGFCLRNQVRWVLAARGGGSGG